MRRLQMEASLVTLWLLASGIHGYASGPRKPDRAEVANAAAKKEKTFARTITGWAESREDAVWDAVVRARGQIEEFLTDKGVRLSRGLSPDYVYDKLVKEILKQETKEMPGVGMVREVQLRVEMTALDYDNIMALDRQFIAQNRMLLMGKILAGLVALLAAVAGYFRLEEATKGYYTTWLRLATLGFVAAIGGGLWLITVR